MFEWESDFEQGILERGWRYAQAEAVKHLTREGERIDAIVEGSEYYKVSMKYDGHHFTEAYCSCPYAGSGNYCKHMAAVLYEVDQAAGKDADHDDSTYTIDQSSSVMNEISDYNHESYVVSIAEIIRNADREKLEMVLLQLASEDDKIESHILSLLAGSGSLVNISSLKNCIDSIFYAYTDRGGYINYHNASAFADDLTIYLENQTDRLLDEGMYLAAFELSAYAFVRVGNCDIDDDGDIEDISNTCYEIWQRIIADCTDDEREQIKSRFQQYIKDGTVVDYMQDWLREFLQYELVSQEELQAELAYLDGLIEESSGSNKCKAVYSLRYGHRVEAIKMRIILMQKTGASEDEIDAFRRRYTHLQSVRDYYLKKAREEGNTEEEIRILKESKALDQDSAYLFYSYSKRLIELYHNQGQHDLEKAERKESFLSCQTADVKEFRAYRSMCSEEEWEDERKLLIVSRQSIEKRCELLAEEKMISDLYTLISEAENNLPLYDQYGFLMAGSYSEPILRRYQDYVVELADYARNRSGYDKLTRYLKRMQQYEGGHEMVRRLCREWIAKYPTRKVMLQELKNVMGGLSDADGDQRI